jgi:hypothetical protein
MLDYSNYPLRDNTQIFHAQNSAIYQTWEKPRGCKFVYIFMLGAGGAGAGGVTGASGTNRNGSGGGGSGGLFTCFFPSILIPDRLYILVGKGGIGANPNTNGAAGGVSIISTIGNISNVGQGLFARPSQATGGNLGGTGGGGVSVLNGVYRYLGINSLYSSTSGGNGGNGTTGTNGGSITITFPFGGGGGGGSATSGGVSLSGGNIIGTGFTPTILGGVSPGENGQNGFSSFNSSSITDTSLPLFFTGGAGGAGNATGIGGNGGNGAYGCGGGGGGTGTTGGRGGNGGDGIVIITWW